MKVIIVLICFLMGSNSIANAQLKNGVDSINKVRWEYDIISVNSWGEPLEYIKREYYFLPHKRVCCIQCDTSYRTYNLYTPEEAKIYFKVDSMSTDYGIEYCYNFDNGGYRSWECSFPSYKIDNDVLEKWYYKNKLVVQIDSIIFYNYKVERKEARKGNGVMKNYCEYKNYKKHGKEIIYYSAKELLGIVIYKNYHQKTTGYWKNDVKDGIWKEYYPNGNLKKKQKYKNGNLVKEKNRLNKIKRIKTRCSKTPFLQFHIMYF